MTGVAYAARVLHQEREAFETEQGWTIKTMHSKVPSPVRDEYAPTVLFQETLGHLASLDMMSGEVRPSCTCTCMCCMFVCHACMLRM